MPRRVSVALESAQSVADLTEFRSGKASDIISTLVSIHDTREVIIKELQVLLGQRLLAVKDYDAVKEVSRSQKSRADDRSER